MVLYGRLYGRVGRCQEFFKAPLESQTGLFYFLLMEFKLATCILRDWIEVGSKKTGTLNFAIVVNGQAVGGIRLIFKDDVYLRTAEVGYWLGEEFWGRGIMTEAVKALTEYAFSHFKILRIYAPVFEWNHASMKVLEKAGYMLEARLKKNVTKEGKTVDELIFSVVRE
jgi:ribosomal-protein-alanine N-acetyltransferase